MSRNVTVMTDVEAPSIDDRAAYPADWEADVVLRDGAVASIRPIHPSDADALQEMHLAQSAESVYLRFFAPLPKLSDRDLKRFTHVDHCDRVALIAQAGDKIIGVGRYDRVDVRSAEVAFNISDQHQGRGLGSVLLEHLAAAARERGIHRFVADVLPQNRKMVSVFKDAGYEVTHNFDDGVISLGFDIDPTERSQEVMRAREHRAESASIQGLLTPQSVAVIGAGRHRNSVGRWLLHNMMESGFDGPIYAVNNVQYELAGATVLTKVADIPEPVDLAIIAVPTRSALTAVHECGKLGARAIAVVSGGFAESGPEGRELQRQVVDKAHNYGMRVVGPNSFGLINTADEVNLNASLSPFMPSTGRLGLFSQSGALSVAVLSAADTRGLGVSSFVSAGNRADVSGNDLMQYWTDDEATKVVGLYLESIGNPRKFSRIARRLASEKPVIVVKSGITGFSVPPGHEVRVTRAPREAFDAMLKQSGVIKVENLHQLLDTAQVLVDQPLPTGSRVGIVGNSDALATLIADAVTSWGLIVHAQPVTIAPQAGAREFRKALEHIYAIEQVDSVVAAFVPPLTAVDSDIARTLVEVAGKSTKTTVACLLGMRGVGDHEVVSSGRGQDAGPVAEWSRRYRTVPSFPTPEDAVRALVSATRYSQWRRRDHGEELNFPDIDEFRAQILIEEALASGLRHPAGQMLSEEQAAALLDAYGITLWRSVNVTTDDEAVAAAKAMGWPVALKAAKVELREQHELLGVDLGIDDESALRHQMNNMRANLPDLQDGFQVQRMAPTGVSVTIRSLEDPLFGPVVSFGLSGDASDLLGDIVHRVPPLRSQDVSDMVRSIKGAPRLFGYRGGPGYDIAALEEVLGRIAVLADNHPEILELILTPVKVAQEGVCVLGARVRVSRTSDRADDGTRRVI